MGRSIDSLINEADELVFGRSKTAAAKPQIVDSVHGDTEAVKIANQLLSEDEGLQQALNLQKTAAPVAETALEKVASALVINEVLLNLEKFEKIEQFEKKAQEQGYSQEEINELIIEKLL